MTARYAAIVWRRGCPLRGRGLDLELALQILRQDHRSGAPGRIRLETTAARAEMIAAA